MREFHSTHTYNTHFVNAKWNCALWQDGKQEADVCLHVHWEPWVCVSQCRSVCEGAWDPILYRDKTIQSKACVYVCVRVCAHKNKWAPPAVGYLLFCSSVMFVFGCGCLTSTEIGSAAKETNDSKNSFTNQNEQLLISLCHCAMRLPLCWQVCQNKDANVRT